MHQYGSIELKMNWSKLIISGSPMKRTCSVPGACTGKYLSCRKLTVIFYRILLSQSQKGKAMSISALTIIFLTSHLDWMGVLERLFFWLGSLQQQQSWVWEDKVVLITDNYTDHKHKKTPSVANEKSNLNFGQRQRSCSSGNTEDEDGDCPVDAALGRPMHPGCCKCGGYLSKKLKSTFFQWTSKISKLETMWYNTWKSGQSLTTTWSTKEM